MSSLRGEPVLSPMSADCALVQAGIMTTHRSAPVPARVSTHHFLAEVRVLIQAEQDLSWIARSLHAACRRINRTGSCLELVSALYSPADDRLSCLVVAESWEDVRDLFELALLPPARVLEVVKVEEHDPPVRLD